MHSDSASLSFAHGLSTAGLRKALNTRQPRGSPLGESLPCSSGACTVMWAHAGWDVPTADRPSARGLACPFAGEINSVRFGSAQHSSISWYQYSRAGYRGGKSIVEYVDSTALVSQVNTTRNILTYDTPSIMWCQYGKVIHWPMILLPLSYIDTTRCHINMSTCQYNTSQYWHINIDVTYYWYYHYMWLLRRDIWTYCNTDISIWQC
jgi:hypothetical protein